MNSNFFTLKYWFNVYPGSLNSGVVKYFIAFLIALFAATFFVNILKKKKDNDYAKVLERYFNFGVTNLILGLLLFFFAYEGVPFLSVRFLYILWAVGMLAWLIFISLDFRKIPEIKKQREEKKEFQKYIP